MRERVAHTLATMSIILWQRVGNHVPANVSGEVYPSAHATGRFTPAQNASDSRDRVPASEAEPRAINCAQCGAHIEDYASLNACWHCESDNFLGRELTQ